MATEEMVPLDELQQQILAAARCDDDWAHLVQSMGEQVLLSRCHQLVGLMVDACRVAFADLPPVERAKWLMRLRYERDAVDRREAVLEAVVQDMRRPRAVARVQSVPAWRRPRLVGDAEDWLGEAHRIVDLAGGGLSMTQAAKQLGTSLDRLRTVLRQAGVPVPWAKGRPPPGGIRASRTYRMAVEVLAVKMAEAGR